MYPPQMEPSTFLPLISAGPRSSLRWEALLDGLLDLERASLLAKWTRVVAALPRSSGRDSALSMARAASTGIEEVVWARPVRNDLTVQPFSTSAAAWQAYKYAVEQALEALAAAM